MPTTPASPSTPSETGTSPASGGGRRDLATDLGLLALATIWGINFSVVKLVLRELDPLAVNALRFPMASLALWVLVRRQAGPTMPRPGDRLRTLSLGVLGNVVYQMCFIIAIGWTLAGNASLLLATTPVWTIALSTYLGHERPSAAVMLGVAATLAGMVLVVLGSGDAIGMGGASLPGDLLMIAAAVLWSLYTVGSRRLILEYGSVRATAWTVWVGTVGVVLIGMPSLVTTDFAQVSAWTWLGVVYAGLLALGVAYLLWYRGVQRLGNSRTAVYSNLVPVTALLTAWLWLGEVPTVLQLSGAAVILAGLTLARFGADYSPEPSSGRWRTSGNS